MPRCGRPSQEALSAQVFVEVGPVDAVSTPSYLPVDKLFRSSVEKPGYQARGTLMTLPSRNVTLSESVEKLTLATLSSAFSAKMPIPSL